MDRRHGHNSYGSIKEASIHNMEHLELNESWNPQGPGQPTRWPARHMVACSSCDGHVTEYGDLVLFGMGTHLSCSDWGSGHDLGCRKGGSWGGVGHSQD